MKLRFEFVHPLALDARNQKLHYGEMVHTRCTSFKSYGPVKDPSGSPLGAAILSILPSMHSYFKPNCENIFVAMMLHNLTIVTRVQIPIQTIV